jgi:hypothetical protein
LVAVEPLLLMALMVIKGAIAHLAQLLRLEVVMEVTTELRNGKRATAAPAAVAALKAGQTAKELEHLVKVMMAATVTQEAT